MVDNVCEPFMRVYGDLSILKTLFGTGKGSGAALMMLILGVSGSLICIITGKKLNYIDLSAVCHNFINQSESKDFVLYYSNMKIH